MALIELQGINKSFGTKDKKVSVLEDLSLKVDEGEMITHDEDVANVCDRTIFLDKH